jgi:hypothetical protein
MVKIRNIQDLPSWSEPLLQGITFWIGYKKQLYRHYPLSEGAIIGEACHIVYANISESDSLICEKMYKEMGIRGAGQTRADLVIIDKTTQKEKIIIEVKRNSASGKLINDDLKRLAEVKKTKKNVRCFLLLVSQSLRPKAFVNDNGMAVKKTFPFTDFHANVRRACKATGSFKGKDSAHYACLIEVNV